jgi:cytosine/adenosine deaminase-related metal-dependent hydrolase
MPTILLEHIDTLATFDEQRLLLRNAWVLVRDNQIEAIGVEGAQPTGADQTMDLSGYVVLPGLISTHHHNFQTLLRNIPHMENASLFPWLHDLYLLMSEVRDEDQYVATMVAHAELLLSGCTTTVDHSYLKVNDMKFDTEIQAAQEIGIRFHLARGSFSVGESQGGLPPDHIVEKEDDILADTEALIQKYHDPKPFAMVRVDNAPCSPFSVSDHLMRESIKMARRYGVGNHTHLAENMDDHRYVMSHYGMSSVKMAESLGWVGPDVWFAHGVVLDDDDIRIMAETGTAICHCPCSNQFLASGVCKVTPMLKKGVTIGLGVDGSASNNSSNMLDEVREACLLQRVNYGADALAPTQALELATLGSARLLRRNDIGVLAPGKAADLIGIELNKLSFAGGLHDPVAALVLCASGQVDLSMVNGKLRVVDGQLVGVDLPALIKEQNRIAANLVQRTEKRYGVNLSEMVWRRAFPYDE